MTFRRLAATLLCVLAFIFVPSTAGAAETSDGSIVETDEVACSQTENSVARLTVGTTTNYYGTLQDAIDAAGESAGTITILQDFTLGTLAADDAEGAAVVAEGQNLVIDLNGCTVTLADDASTTVAIYVESGASLTLNDLSESSSGEVCAEMAVACAGDLTVRGGTYVSTSDDSDDAAIKCLDGGVIAIHGGSFIGQDASSAIRLEEGGALSVYDGSAQSDTGAALCMAGGTATIHGGSFESESGNAWYVAADSTLSIYGGTFTSDTGAAGCISAKTGAAGSVVAVYDGTFTSSNAECLWLGSGTVTIDGGTFTGGDGCLVCVYAEIEIDGGEFTGGEGNAIKAYYPTDAQGDGFVGEGGELVIYGGTFQATGDDATFGLIWVLDNSDEDGSEWQSYAGQDYEGFVAICEGTFYRAAGDSVERLMTSYQLDDEDAYDGDPDYWNEAWNDDLANYYQLYGTDMFWSTGGAGLLGCIADTSDGDELSSWTWTPISVYDEDYDEDEVYDEDDVKRADGNNMAALFVPFFSEGDMRDEERELDYETTLLGYDVHFVDMYYLPDHQYRYASPYVIEEATCTEDGLEINYGDVSDSFDIFVETLYACANCGWLCDVNYEWMLPAILSDDEAETYAAYFEEEYAAYLEGESEAFTAIPATGHDWVFDEDSWVWTEDGDGGYTVTATEYCLTCGETKTLTATVTSETDEDGSVIWTATVTADGEPLDEDADGFVDTDEDGNLTYEAETYTSTLTVGSIVAAHWYDWDYMNWVWTEVTDEDGNVVTDEDGNPVYTVTCSSICKLCSEHYTVDLDTVVTYEVIDSTCNDAGAIVYTATCMVDAGEDGEFETDDDLVIWPGDDGEYGTSDDYYTYGDGREASAEDASGGTLTLTDTYVLALDSTGHTYDFSDIDADKDWTWTVVENEDGSEALEATLDVFCIRGDATLTLPAEVTAVSTEPTDDADGTITYTATVKLYTSTDEDGGTLYWAETDENGDPVYIQVELPEGAEPVTGDDGTTWYEFTDTVTYEYSSEGYEGVYDGAAHSITVTAPEGSTVTYATSEDGEYGSENPSYTDAGEYTVYYQITQYQLSDDTYATAIGSDTVKITADKTFSLTYDGNAVNDGDSVSDVPEEGSSYDSGDEAALASGQDMAYMAADGSAVAFIGWSFTDTEKIYADGEEEELPETVSSVAFADADITVYAVWGYDENGNGTADVLEDTYTLTYDGNAMEGDAVVGTPESVVTVSGVTITLDDGSGLTYSTTDGTAVVFAGWTTSENEKIYSSGDVLDTIDEVTIEDADITVYAAWGYDEDGDGVADVLENAYTLTYDANAQDGDTVTGTPSAVTVSSGVTVTLDDGSAMSYEASDGTAVVFVGWTLTENDSIYAFGDEVETVDEVTFEDADITVYAAWGYDEDGDGVADVLEDIYHLIHDDNVVDGDVASDAPFDLMSYLAGIIAANDESGTVDATGTADTIETTAEASNANTATTASSDETLANTGDWMLCVALGMVCLGVAALVAVFCLRKRTVN